MDGNIGIGGDPAALLARIGASSLPREACLFVEAAADDIDKHLEVRFEDGQEAPEPRSPGRGAGFRTAPQRGPRRLSSADLWAVGDRQLRQTPGVPAATGRTAGVMWW